MRADEPHTASSEKLRVNPIKLSAVPVTLQGKDAKGVSSNTSSLSRTELIRSWAFSSGATYVADLYLCK